MLLGKFSLLKMAKIENTLWSSGHTSCDQYYKRSAIVIYDSRVLLNIPKFLLRNAVNYDRRLVTGLSFVLF